MMMIRMNTENPDIYHEIKIKQNQMTLRTIEKEYDDRGHEINRKTLHTDYNAIYESQTRRTNTKYIDFNNEAVFQKFVKEYPEMKTPLTNIRNHFNETRVPNQPTPRFDATKKMSNMSHENTQNQTSNPPKTTRYAQKSTTNGSKTTGDVQHSKIKCPTPPARKSTTKLEHITSDVSPEDETQFE